MSKHFTAVLTVLETETCQPNLQPKTMRNRELVEPQTRHPKDVVEVAKIVVRASSMDQLKKRLAAHVELLEGDEVIITSADLNTHLRDNAVAREYPNGGDHR